MPTELKMYGVRGSMALPKKEYLEYGGNTSSYTLRTPENTLVFLDAGSGIQFAGNELNQAAEKVVLAISHTHADHTMGLGMSALPWSCFRPEYKDKKIQVIGPEGVEQGLRQFYDGGVEKGKNWPVGFVKEGKPNMPSFDYENIVELVEGKEYDIDSSTRLSTIKGNHPVEGGVVLYRFEIEEGDQRNTFVYATDNEFDYVNGPEENEAAEELKKAYVDFIKDADILVADGQYNKEEYIDQGKFHGFGHSYTEQILDLAKEGNVKKVVITHHGRYDDQTLEKREEAAREYAADFGLEVDFAKEGAVYEI